VNYQYLGDKLTDKSLKGKQCEAVKNYAKCIRGRNGNMLVNFGEKKVVVLAKRLRKI
jgi:hypothetical protein